MKALQHGLTPKMRPISPKKSAVLCALDVGSTKVVCLIAQLEPLPPAEVFGGRTHKIKVMGMGHQRSRGIKAGVIIDMEEAEKAIRATVDAAERMAKVEVTSVLATLTGGRIQSQSFSGEIIVPNREISETDVHRVIGAAAAHTIASGRSVLHSLPVGFRLDAARGIKDPRGMIGNKLGVDMHVATCDTATARNVMLAVERGRVSIEAMIGTPYAAGLSTLNDDEAQMGAVVIDMGGGTTSFGVFADGALMHLDAVGIGGHHVTMDIARGLTMRVGDAERLKVLHGSCFSTASDEREMLSIQQVGEDGRDDAHLIPKAQLTRIIAPRVEEIVELVKERLVKSGFGAQAGNRIVLTGGASQLNGMTDVVRRTISTQVRIGRPQSVQGLPEACKSPAFAAAAGMLIYPQYARQEHFETSSGHLRTGTGAGYFGRMVGWMKEAF
jgi:cell division protein FtsA